MFVFWQAHHHYFTVCFFAPILLACTGNWESVDRVLEVRALFPEQYIDIVNYRSQEVFPLRFESTVFYGLLSPWISIIVPASRENPVSSSSPHARFIQTFFGSLSCLRQPPQLSPSRAIPKVLLSTADTRLSIPGGGSTVETCASAPGSSCAIVPASSRQQQSPPLDKRSRSGSEDLSPFYTRSSLRVEQQRPDRKARYDVSHRNLDFERPTDTGLIRWPT